MLNAYYDLPTYKINNKTLVPYVGGGIGTMNVDVGTLTVDSVSTGGGDDDTFAYQLKLGVSYLASENVDIFAEGIYMGSSDFEIEGTSFDGISALGAKGGLRYRF